MLYWTEYVFFVQYSYYTGQKGEKQASLSTMLFVTERGI